jgi:hypothetical protein
MKPICFVCNKPIKHNARYIGQGLYHHIKKCHPLSKNYQEFLELRKLINEQENEFKFDERRELSKQGV